MGFWKDVAYDMSRGMSRETAIEINAILRDKNSTERDRKMAEAKGETEIIINNSYYVHSI